jgi:branched-chain amino acid transport system permease protein
VNNELINYEVMSITESGNVLFNTFIGGMTYFSGPIIGASLLTALQLNLSNYTDAWLVYEGILFVLVVMFAPSGISGIIYAHGPVLSKGLWRRLIPAYGIAAIPGLLLALSGIFLIEFIYHWSSASYVLAAEFRLFWITWHPVSPWPWLVMLVGQGAGLYLLLRYGVPAVRAAWAAVNESLSRDNEP